VDIVSLSHLEQLGYGVVPSGDMRIVLQYSSILSERLTDKEFLVTVLSLELEGNIGCGYTSYFDCGMYLRTLNPLFFVCTRSRSSVFCVYEMQVTSVSWGCDLSKDFTIYLLSNKICTQCI
jgi:hypothetical protein